MVVNLIRNPPPDETTPQARHPIQLELMLYGVSPWGVSRRVDYVTNFIRGMRFARDPIPEPVDPVAPTVEVEDVADPTDLLRVISAAYGFFPRRRWLISSIIGFIASRAGPS